jgi:hypothetical protein
MSTYSRRRSRSQGSVEVKVDEMECRGDSGQEHSEDCCRGIFRDIPIRYKIIYEGEMNQAVRFVNDDFDSCIKSTRVDSEIGLLILPVVYYARGMARIPSVSGYGLELSTLFSF